MNGANAPFLETTRLLTRGASAVYSFEELSQRLAIRAKQDKPLRVKLGMDPSSPDIHLGHAVVLRLMRRFQDAGHKAVLIIGDYTARIGDPSGKSKTRPMLSPEQIDANAKTYLAQATRILDPDPRKLELRSNSEWLSTLTFADILRLCSQTTVARMMERDTFEKRFAAGQPIALHEFLYPIMQGYDSVCVRADIELGGTDQTFNNLFGRDMQTAVGQEPQIVITMPILRGLDGHEKMSKSLGNYIGVTANPNDMFGKTMSIPDALMEEWFTLCTEVPPDEIQNLIDANKTHPREAKEKLGRLIVSRFHGLAAAEAAAAEFAHRFSQGALPTDLETKRVPEPSLKILALMTAVGFAESNSEARRLVSQGAVAVDGAKISDPNTVISIGNGVILKVGKMRVCKVVAG